MVPMRKNQIQTIRPGMDECAADQSQNAKLMNALAKTHDRESAIASAVAILPMMIVFVIPTLFLLWAAFAFHPPPSYSVPSHRMGGGARQERRKENLSIA